MKPSNIKRVISGLFSLLLFISTIMGCLSFSLQDVYAESGPPGIEEDTSYYKYYETFINNTNEITNIEKDGMKYYFQYESGDSEYPYYLDIPQLTTTTYASLLVSKGTDANGGEDVLIGFNKDGTYNNEGHTINVVRIKMKNQLYIGKDLKVYVNNLSWGYNLNDSNTCRILTTAESYAYANHPNVINLNYGYEIERTTLDVSYDLFNDLKLQAKTTDIFGYKMNIYNVEDWGTLAGVANCLDKTLDECCENWLKANGQYFLDSAKLIYQNYLATCLTEFKKRLNNYNSYNELESHYKEEANIYWENVNTEGWYTLTAEDMLNLSKLPNDLNPGEYISTSLIDYNNKILYFDMGYYTYGGEAQTYYNELFTTYKNVKFPSKVTYNNVELTVYYDSHNTSAFPNYNRNLIKNIWIDDNFTYCYIYNPRYTSSSLNNYSYDLTEILNSSNTRIGYNDDYLAVNEEGRVYIKNGIEYDAGCRMFSYFGITGIKIGKGINCLPTSFVSYSNELTYVDCSNASDLKFISNYCFQGNKVKFYDFSKTNLQYIGYSNFTSDITEIIKFNKNVVTYIYSGSSLYGNKLYWIVDLNTPYISDNYSTLLSSSYPMYYSLIENVKYSQASSYGALLNKNPFLFAYYKNIEKASGLAISNFIGNTTINTYLGPNITSNKYGNKISYNDGNFYPGMKINYDFYHNYNIFVDILESNWDNIFAEPISYWEERYVGHVFTRKAINYLNMEDTNLSNFQTSYFKTWVQFNENPDNQKAIANYSPIEYEKDKLNNIAPAVKEGYNFTGYILSSKSINNVLLEMNEDGTTTIPDILDEDITLTATFCKKVFIVREYDKIGSTNIKNFSYVGYNESYNPLNTPTKADEIVSSTLKKKFEFNKYVNENNEDVNIEHITSNISIYPLFNETNINLVSKEFKSISVMTQPYKLTYDAKECFNDTGLKIKATYLLTWDDNTTTEYIEEDTTYEVDTTTPLLFGTTYVTISKTIDEVTKTCNLGIDVNSILEERYLDRLEITRNPVKLTYTYGEVFNKAGLEVRAIYKNKYSNGECIEDYEENVDFEIINADTPLTHNDLVKTISYTSNGITKTKDIIINVNKVLISNNLDSIEIVNSPKKTKYLVGEVFESDGLVVKAIYKQTYSDGSYSYSEIDNIPFTTNTTSPLTYEDTTQIISYTSGDITKTTSIDIQVTPYTVINFYKEDKVTLIESLTFFLNETFISINNPTKEPENIPNGVITYTFGGWKIMANDNTFVFDIPNEDTGTKTINLYEFFNSKTTYNTTLTINYYDYLDNAAFKDNDCSYKIATTITNWNNPVELYQITPNNKIKVIKTNKGFDNTQIWAFDKWEYNKEVPNTFISGENVEITAKAIYKLISESYIDNEILDKIEILTPPNKLEYNQYDKFNKDGLSVLATYKQIWNDNHITYRYESNIDYNTNTTKNLLYSDTYQEISFTYNGVTKTINQPITVNSIIESTKLNSLIISHLPNKNTYKFGEVFNKTGLKINAIYLETWSDGTTTNKIVEDIEYDVIDELKELTHLDTNKTISYTDEGITKTINIDLVIEKILISSNLNDIKIITSANKTIYDVGEVFNDEGLSVKAHYIDIWSDETITDTYKFIDYDTNKETPLDYSNNINGQVISYTENNVTVTTKQPITVLSYTILNFYKEDKTTLIDSKKIYYDADYIQLVAPLKDNLEENKKITKYTFNSWHIIENNEYFDKFDTVNNVTTNEIINLYPIYTETYQYLTSLTINYYDYDDEDAFINDNNKNTLVDSITTTWQQYVEKSDIILNNRTIKVLTDKGFENTQLWIFKGWVYETPVPTYFEGIEDVIINAYPQYELLEETYIADEVLNELVITQNPNKLNYTYGETFNKEGLEVKAIYKQIWNNNQITYREVENIEISVDETIPLTHDSNIIISYTDGNITKTITQEIVVDKILISDVLDSIELVNNPNKLSYNKNDKFDSTGIVMKGIYKQTYSDGSILYRIVNNIPFEVDTNKLLNYGDNTVEIIVKDGEIIKSININIQVKAIIEKEELFEIYLISNPNKVSYIESDTFNKDGLIIGARYEQTWTDGSKTYVTKDNIEGFNVDTTSKLSKDDKIRVVTYKEGNIEVSLEVLIFVNENYIILKELDRIEVSKLPNRTTYYEEEKFDKTGLVIDGIYKNYWYDGNITYTTINGIKYEITNEEKILVIGDKNIKITYKDNDISKEINIEIIVKAKELTYTIQGMLLYSNGKPMANTKIELHSTPRVLYTDVNGFYKFESVESGEHTLILYDRSDSMLGSCKFTLEDKNITNVKKGNINGFDIYINTSSTTNTSSYQITIDISALYTNLNIDDSDDTTPPILDEKDFIYEDVEVNPSPTPDIVPDDNIDDMNNGNNNSSNNINLDDNIPDTGDTNSLGLYILLLTLSGLSGLSMLIYNINNRKKIYIKN